MQDAGAILAGRDPDCIDDSGDERRQGCAGWNPGATSCICNMYDPDPYVGLLVPGDGTIYVAGHFSIIGGQDRGGLAELDLATGAPTSWDPRMGPRIEDSLRS